MRKKLIILAKASNRKIEINIIENITILQLLQNNNIPIASSCRGEGICRKCVINDEVLSCQYLVSSFIEIYGNTISIDYL